ncbi:hypothetical protein DMC47_05675 [Nostoc sp. 3335mG]|nr:hypothetical protein DMC47_05675 [Nostoc sp. 3335mG]
MAPRQLRLAPPSPEWGGNEGGVMGASNSTTLIPPIPAPSRKPATGAAVASPTKLIRGDCRAGSARPPGARSRPGHLPVQLFTCNPGSAVSLSHHPRRMVRQSPEGSVSMSATTEQAGYSRAQVIIHWTVVVLILFQLFFHEGMEMAFDARMEGGGTAGNPVPHIIAGSLILILAATRVIIRLTRGAPPHPKDQPAFLGVLANVTHGLIYLLLFAMPLSGLVAWFGGVEGAGDAHSGFLRIALIAAVILHVAGALVQQFVLRSGVLMRMLRPES